MQRVEEFLQGLIFPIPRQPTYSTDSHPGKLVHIPIVEPITKQPLYKYTFGYMLLPRTPVQYCMIYAHPNAVDIGMMYYEMKYICKKASIAILLFEYTGYGLASGSPEETTVYRDAFSAYYFVRNHLHIPSNHIVLCGRSIGSAVVAKLCSTLSPEEQPALLILQCPFSSIKNYVRDFIPNAERLTRYFGYDLFRTNEIIASVRCPVVLDHGNCDETIDISHSYELKAVRDASPAPRVTYMYVEEGKDHNNLSREVLVNILKDKLETVDPLPFSAERFAKYVVRTFDYDAFYGPSVHTMEELREKWFQSPFRLSHFVFSREKFPVFLSLGITFFTLRCCREWQNYCQKLKELGLEKRLTPSEFVLNTGAIYVSPVSINIEIKEGENTLRRSAMLFGCRVSPSDIGSYDVPIDIVDPYAGCYHTLFEIKCGIDLEGFKKFLVNSPLLTEGAPPVDQLVRRDAARETYLNCERMVAFMEDEEWNEMQQLLRNLFEEQTRYMSPKLCQFLSVNDVSAGWRGEVLRDVEEWLAPWVEEHNRFVKEYSQKKKFFEQHNYDWGDAADSVGGGIGAEIPWDYYLLKARWLRHTNVIPVKDQTSQELFYDFLSQSLVVRQVYVLYRRYKNHLILPL